MSSKEDSFHLGVKALIRNREGKVLLLEKERRSSQQTYWDLPGGRLQKGETELEALQREVEEEVGLKKIDNAAPLSMHLTNIRIPSLDSDVGLIISLYTLEVLLDFTPILSDEHVNFGWFDISETARYLETQFPAELVALLAK